MPRQPIRSSNSAALVSAALWVVATVVLATSRGFQDGMSTRPIWIMPTLFGVVTFAVAAVGVLLRTGGLGGLWPGVTLAALGIGLGLSIIGTWAWPLWGAFLAIAALPLVLRLRSASLGIRITDWLLVAAWPIGVGLSILLIGLHVGPLDIEGDYPVSTGAGFGVGALLFAGSLALLGHRLRSVPPPADP